MKTRKKRMKISKEWIILFVAVFILILFIFEYKNFETEL